MTAADEAVTKYLTFLTDPESLRDDEDIAKKKAAIEKAKTPIARVKAISALKVAETVDGKPLRDAFVQVAKSWAEQNKVVPEAFIDEGVKPEDLKAAGFDIAVKGARRNGSTPSAPRAARVAADDIKKWVLALPSGTEFVIKDVMEGAGGSDQTVRAVVVALVAEEEVGNQGPKPGHKGPKAPTLYVRA